MTTLSVTVITKDESSNITECLESVEWADEIIVLDSGSEDNTVSLAREFTSHVYEEWDWKGFGIQKQRAQNLASGDWILSIDADERVTRELSEEIKQVIKENNQQYVYMVPRLSYCFGRFIRHSGWYPDYVTRLYPREKAHFNDNLVHESIVYDKRTMSKNKLTGDLLHYTYRDMEHYLVKSANYAALWAKQRKQDNKKSSLFQGITHSLSCFLKMYVFKAGFLDGRQGFLLAILSAHSTFVKYADLWVRNQVEPQSSK